MSKKNHAEAVATEENEFTSQEEFGSEENFDEGLPTLNITVSNDGVESVLTIAAPDKYNEGHVMTTEEAAHYSNFIRSRCASNMISLAKRNKRVWNETSAAEYYDAYVLGAPRGRGPSDETVRDEALEALLDEIAAASGKSVPRGKGSLDKRNAMKEALGKSAKHADRLAALELEIRAEYAAKSSVKAVKSDSISLDDLLG